MLFGGTGTTPGTVQVSGASSTSSYDLMLAKYTDNGSSATLGWAQVGGGTGYDQGSGVAVSGPNVYMTGSIENNAANTRGVLFGSTGTTPGTVPVPGASSTSSYDLVLAKYTDNGSTATAAWAQVGGGTDRDEGYGVAVSGQSVVAVGYVIPSASFGSITIAGPVGDDTGVLARVVDTSLAPLPPGAASTGLALYPNPAHGTTMVAGLAAGARVQVLSMLGSVVAEATADAGGTAQLTLPAGVAAGVYVVRGGNQALRLVVE